MNTLVHNYFFCVQVNYWRSCSSIRAESTNSCRRRVEHEVRVTEHTQFRTVEPFNFGLCTDAERGDEIADLKPHKGHGESEHRQHPTVDHLHEELGEVAVEKPTHAVRAVQLRELITDDSVPACAVLAGC